MVYVIGDDCKNCGACAGACPVSCISPGKGKYVIDSSKCIGCGTCFNVCPYDVPKPDLD